MGSRRKPHPCRYLLLNHGRGDHPARTLYGGHALKVAQDSYKAEKAAERAAAKDGVSLAGEARDMETGKDALAGDDPAKSSKSRTGQDIAQ